ncbi:MAG TPA: TonB family protein [Candidatus Acidoferrales bacterium]|nr:TonB family protein [Candidatus Acidoferrales bacterium]
MSTLGIGHHLRGGGQNPIHSNSLVSETLTPSTYRNFDIRFRPPIPSKNPEAWQKLIGDRPIGARLEPLPEHPTNWRALATSTFTQVAVVVLFLLLQIIFPQNLMTRIAYDVVPLAGPMIEIPTAKRQPVRPKVEPHPIQVTPPQHVAKLFAPRPLPAPKPKPVELRTADIPKVEQTPVVPKLDVPESAPVRPREVKMGVLGDSPAGGGFGDPHGLPGAADPSKQVNIAHVGAFDSNVGSGVGSGNGNGTGVGGNGGRGNGAGIAAAGFADGTAFASARTAEAPRKVQSTGFQSAEVTPAAPAKGAAKQADVPPPTQAVAILSKPTPVYTDEARRLGIEGEVLVDVVFLASGQVKVEGVSKGLGHGLDEAAIRAAQQIRFKPALQEGRPVDFPATVHIVFQIAF